MTKINLTEYHDKELVGLFTNAYNSFLRAIVIKAEYDYSFINEEDYNVEISVWLNEIVNLCTHTMIEQNPNIYKFAKWIEEQAEENKSVEEEEF